MNKEPLKYDPSLRKKPMSIRLLGMAKRLIPGDYLKTWAYLHLINTPRRAIRTMVCGFYRIDQIYEILDYANKRYAGRFSILEFGTADGYSFIKMLYATRYMGMEDRVTVHAFDTFEGMPPPQDARDINPVTGDTWVEGQFHGREEELKHYCERKKYNNFRIHKGLFSDTLTQDLVDSLRSEPPILIWMDCDFYSSTRSAFERLLPVIPNGCVIYFDDIDQDMSSRFAGEARLVSEINSGDFGEVQLVLDQKLSLDSTRCYRFFRESAEVKYQARATRHTSSYVRPRGDGSPWP